MLYLEVGNTTFKLAEQEADGSFIIHRFDTPADLLAFIPSDRRLLVAPVAAAKAHQILPDLEARHQIEMLEREDFTEFIGDTYDTPETLGLDRILHLSTLDEECIVISCGTGITIDALHNGKPSWGAILAGFRTASEGLSAHAPALPIVSLDDLQGLPARTSRGSLANGLLLGTGLAVQSLVTLLANALGLEKTAPVILTGGDMDVLATLWNGERTIVRHPDLLFTAMVHAKAQRDAKNAEGKET